MASNSDADVEVACGSASPNTQQGDELTNSVNDKEAKKEERSVKQMRKRIKRLICIIVFIIILGSSVLSKLSLLFMISHIGANRKVPYCNIQSAEEQLYATIPDKQRIGWIWAIVFAYAIPELIILFKAWLTSFHRNDIRSGFTEFAVVFFVETLHVIGLSLFIFVVLPNLNVIQSVMLTNCLSFGPALLIMVMDRELEKTKRLLNILAIFAQITGFILWPVMSENVEVWCIPAAIILISFHWWKNFVPADNQPSQFTFLNKLKTSSSTSLFVSPWKIFVFLNCAICLSSIPLIEFLEQSIAGWGYHRIEITNSANIASGSVFSSSSVIYWTLLIQIASSFVCYVFTLFAYKIKMQAVSFTLAINLTVPVSICLLLFVCGARALNACAYHNILPDYLFFISPLVYNLADYLMDEYGWIWILWILSQAWITRHTRTTNPIDESTNSLFITPMYNGLIIDQSLMLNRRRYCQSDSIKHKMEYEVPLVYVCATMWHEDETEMSVFLKSILRMDKDFSMRHGEPATTKRPKDFFVQEIENDYYDMDTHIFFDDAFAKDQNINDFVTIFVRNIPNAAREVYKRDMHIPAPDKYDTKYGGRLEWILPGQTKMTVHLKHSDKVRGKKRWSQIMYMKYLLRYKQSFPPRNTFILALDGDIDFQPDAVHLLVNRMKTNDKLGAACGRIHPIGDGPIAWYQKFEYAIGHWLQKTTEHVLGCVLCSPGCFSIFRESALTNVMDNYSVEPSCAKRFIQYDQGEDRWLSTLILNAGWRIEYSAAAKAYTHCPTSFDAIFRQRLRWISSTLANTVDFLSCSREIIDINESITMPYIIYQILLLIGTILGPGTIFLMMIGGLTAVFDIDISIVFLWNLVPIVIFMLVCYNLREYQLPVARFLAGIYCLVMMTVLIAMIIQFIRDGLVSPSSVFFSMVIGQILIAAVLHPQEIGCLPYGIMYYMTIPTMYMLLIIYAVFNLNVILWGTREQDNTIENDQNNSEGLSSIKNRGILCCSKIEIINLGTTPTTPLLDEQKEETTKVETKYDWMNNCLIKSGQLKVIDPDEYTFWFNAIQNDLKPNDPTLLPKDIPDLDEFRDKCVAQFVILNALFVLVVYEFQMNKDYFYIQWPFGAQDTLYFDDCTALGITIVRKYFQIEPIGFLFIVFFGLILIIQFFAMLVHRFGTLCEVLASTELGWNYTANDSKIVIRWQHFVNFVKHIRIFKLGNAPRLEIKKI